MLGNGRLLIIITVSQVLNWASTWKEWVAESTSPCHTVCRDPGTGLRDERRVSPVGKLRERGKREKGQEGPEGLSSAWLDLEVTLHVSAWVNLFHTGPIPEPLMHSEDSDCGARGG